MLHFLRGLLGAAETRRAPCTELSKSRHRALTSRTRFATPGRPANTDLDERLLGTMLLEALDDSRAFHLEA